MLGNLALVLQVLTIVLVVVWYRTAPLVAAVAGSALALGFAAAHWLPARSAMSDPVWSVESLAWVTDLASAAEIVTAGGLAYAGSAVLRRRGTGSLVASGP